MTFNGPIPDGWVLIVLAALALVGTIGSPLILSTLTERHRVKERNEDKAERAEVARLAAEEKAEDRKRQDATISAARDVADKAAQAADDLVAAQASTTAAAEEVARLAAENAGMVSDKLAEIHTLVNSDMTAARTSELTMTRLVLATLKRLVDPGEQDLTAIQTATARISELEAILADRLVQQRSVERQQEASKKLAAAAIDVAQTTFDAAR